MSKTSGKTAPSAFFTPVHYTAHCTHKEAGHVEVVAGHVHEDPAAVLQVRHRRRRGVSAGDVDGAHVSDRAGVDLTTRGTERARSALEG